MRVLDYGCGSGGFEEIDYRTGRLGSWLLAHSGPESYGIDINPLRIEAARSRINSGTNLLVMDGRKLDFPDSHFDMVHSWGVFHHMPDYERGLKEIHRVLKPGGIYLMTESVDNDPVFRLTRRIFNSWDGDEVASYFHTRQLDRTLTQYFDIREKQYYWRFTLSDFLREYHLEPKISLKINMLMSKLFNAAGLGEKTCCHYVVQATKRS